MTIDWWTLGLQTVNVVILIWLLERFFWRPVAAMIEERHASAQRILAEAEGKRSQAIAELAGIEQTRAGLAREREAILAAAHEAADNVRVARLDEAAKAAASLEANAKAVIEKEKALAEKAWTSGQAAFPSILRNALSPNSMARRCETRSCPGFSRRSGLCQSQCGRR